MTRFKEENTFESRESESIRILKKYPTRIPVICEKDPKSQITNMNKRKFLVPDDLTVSQFSYVIRKRVKIRSDIAIFLMVDEGFVNASLSMKELYNKYKDKDGFVYMTYSSENVFG